ncbi:MAG: hypothetical protein WAX89_00275 [Alphaproteobacteria bacterium]
MSSLPTLIKLIDKKLEQIQVIVAQKEQELQQLDATEKSLNQQVEAAHKAAQKHSTPADYRDVEAFSRKTVEDVKKLHARRAQVKDDKEKLLEVIRQLFSEKKRYEVLQEQQEKAAKLKKARKEQATLEDLTNRK